MRLKIVLALLVAVLFRSTISASEWKLDKSHSKILFTVQHLVISEVTGYFRDFDIKVQSTNPDFSDMIVEAVIQVNSLTTDHERRDNHLKSDDFFNVEKFPKIIFTSTKVESGGDNVFRIHGNLTIRDVTKAVVFDAVHAGTIKTSQGERAGWKATLTINRFDFGLKWNRAIETGALVAGEDVNITVNLEVIRDLQEG
jgi:polyisoprenoid-binding protein YceI